MTLSADTVVWHIVTLTIVGGGGGDGGRTGPDPELASVTVTPTVDTIIIRASLQLSATAAAQNGFRSRRFVRDEVKGLTLLQGGSVRRRLDIKPGQLVLGNA